MTFAFMPPLAKMEAQTLVCVHFDELPSQGGSKPWLVFSAQVKSATW